MKGAIQSEKQKRSNKIGNDGWKLNQRRAVVGEAETWQQKD